MDSVRVLRVLEYVGPRDRIEEVLSRSIIGTMDAGRGVTIKAATIGSFPENLNSIGDKESE